MSRASPRIRRGADPRRSSFYEKSDDSASGDADSEAATTFKRKRKVAPPTSAVTDSELSSLQSASSDESSSSTANTKSKKPKPNTKAAASTAAAAAPTTATAPAAAVKKPKGKGGRSRKSTAAAAAGSDDSASATDSVAPAPDVKVRADAAPPPPAAKSEKEEKQAKKPKSTVAAIPYPTTHRDAPVEWERTKIDSVNMQKFFEALCNAELDACSAAWGAADSGSETAYLTTAVQTVLNRFVGKLTQHTLEKVQASRSDSDSVGTVKQPNPENEKLREQEKNWKELSALVEKELSDWESARKKWTAAAERKSAPVSAVDLSLLTESQRATLKADMSNALSKSISDAYKNVSTRGDRMLLMMRHMNECVSMAVQYKENIAKSITFTTIASANHNVNPTQLIKQITAAAALDTPNSPIDE